MRILTYCLFFLPVFGWGQLTVQVNVSARNQKVVLNEPISVNDQVFQLEQIRFYLSKFEFYKNGELTAVDPVEAYLVDFETDSTRKLVFPTVSFAEVDEMRFLFGIDSLVNTSGVMSGALDPMYGMYWSWQSGYINCKLEGTFFKPNRETFQLHLGGYASPFSAVQQVILKTEITAVTQLNIDLDLLMDRVVQSKTELHVMSPCTKAVEYAQILAKSIALKP
jgi:hypothetical protein